MVINFVSSKDNDEKRVMHSKSANIKSCLMKKQVKLLKNLVYQIGSDFIYDCVYLLYYKCHKIFK